jgi:hypothetical protein
LLVNKYDLFPNLVDNKVNYLYLLIWQFLLFVLIVIESLLDIDDLDLLIVVNSLKLFVMRYWWIEEETNLVIIMCIYEIVLIWCVLYIYNYKDSYKV